MIKTPQAARKRRFKTESGYKLRGAMVWVAIGLFAGIAAALAAMGMAIGLGELVLAYLGLSHAGCPHLLLPNVIVLVMQSAGMFIAVGILLFMARKGVAANREPRFGEFSKDVANWFCFGSMLAYAVCAVPLLLAAFATLSC